ncbi:MAG: dihydropteroate synthase [Lachnospiraceae bacterium]|jgi:dihydropteroate synthase|nr:dihydropteroate synthase [Lachnospiraceae bacterium]
MKIGQREFCSDGKHTYVMGILNVTPDSFYDGGRYQSEDAMLRRVEQMLAEGADIIDVGGESTRPGHEPVGVAVEIDRITPVIEMLKGRFDVPVSLDTSKSAVARAGIAAGADMVNDVGGLRFDPQIATVIAETGVACCLMHNQEVELKQDLLIKAINDDLKITLDLAHAAGIADEKIIIDPGVGFGKGYQGDLQILAHLADFKRHGFPCLLGASRKSVIGTALNLPAPERLEGTIITSVMAALAGFLFVRVHDVAANKRALEMLRAINEVGT